jgi:D-alanyl-D-alanine-carboxypeptidase/D-alanyl-D-alanine-endopeptidase
MNRPVVRIAFALLAAVAALRGADRPLADSLARAARDLPAGGFVLAEITVEKVEFSAFGAAAPAGTPPERVLFEIGSITKVFTGLLLAQTVIEGKAALTDPIAKFLPPDVARAMSPAAAAITLGQLATHTSGLAALPANFAPAQPADPYADYTAERLHAFLRGYQPAKSPPQPASYSNIGFGLLGHLLERIHGQSFATLVAARITGPLGMTDTVIALDADRRARFATPHSGAVVVSSWTLDALAGAGALRSTAADMARFAQAIFKNDPAIAAAWELARQPRAPFAGRGAEMGLGVFIGRHSGQPFYNHGGGTGGFRTLLELEPARGRATVLLLNNDEPDPSALVARALRPAPANPDAAKAPERPEVPLAAEKLRDYVGVFRVDDKLRFHVVLDDSGRLRARLTGQGFLPIFHAGADRFFARAVAAEFQFARGADGAVDALALHQGGRELPARRDPAAQANRYLPAAALAAYAGRYELAPGMIFEVTPRGDTLLVKLTGQPAMPVFCTAPDHFAYDAVEATLTFERDATGVVTALVLDQHGQKPRAPRLP